MDMSCLADPVSWNNSSEFSQRRIHSFLLESLGLCSAAFELDAPRFHCQRKAKKSGRPSKILMLPLCTKGGNRTHTPESTRF